ncbi:MMPL family transporter [Halapricum hydrolyticum]|uniref:MMPL family transporter n=1 Tax=Halapricum hydrolyticum TaxID=2979991 RepID=A0AAE3LHV3_9EURY|nr:MMPL family transporter [Halapricum hydrolyticum]MCU4718308.1 MMPL family transporter [Halapricum hydrolyticum]MCU4727244.1 MMPL family transporter [Halapricum hydrolyticum]
MSAADRIVGAVTDHSRLAIAVMLVLTVIVGAGAGAVEQESSLDQFQSDTPEADASEYIDANFASGPENVTRVQIIVRGENVLSKGSLVETLEYQQRLRNDPRLNATLFEDPTGGTPPTVGVANLLAQSALQQEIGGELQRTAAEFEQLNETVQVERQALRQNATELRRFSDDVNATSAALRGGLTELQEDPNASATAVFEETNAATPIDLDAGDAATFEQAAAQLRNASTEAERAQAYELGTRGVLEDELTRVQEWAQTLDQRRSDLQAQAQQLEELGAQLQSLRQELEGVRSASLDRQIEAIDSLEEDELKTLIQTVLGGDGGQASEQALRFMPAGEYYETGSTQADATMLLVTQQTEREVAPGGVASQELIDAQLAMQDLGSGSDLEFLVFGSGIITEEINQSMSDSITLVGPLALLFVVVALAVGYRDLLDIVLGVLGIAAVLVWTFGFMGWAGIDFNQIFIAVPVLLIGLSIDYAIHIFMRHREERFEMGNGALRQSMRVALGGVGIALALVTATTVIGFLSNLVSPVPPIREFGIVSSFGIVAAFLVFGVLTPALKVEIDEFLEARGIDRKKRAIGTGGGRLSQTLKIGSLGAKWSAPVVIVIALLISAGGVYGATQVDTSFSQEDFLAEEPSDWTQNLPEPFAPGEYNAKKNLEYVNERFQRQDAQASILIRGDVAADGTLSSIARAQRDVASRDVTQRLSNGQASIQTPLTVLNDTRERNATVAAIVSDADTDGDGIPDENLTAVYDALFETNPQNAGAVLARGDDGEYTAARLVVDLKGTASGVETTEQLRDVAADVEGDGLTAIATGQTILFEIIQDQLLDTVLESLLITLVSVFGFLMIVYRVTDGSATLGFVTLVPVALSVSWILGTMYLFGIPFNVLTGMITSLTVGLGVAYSIHISERYNQELERHDSAWAALDRSVTGTGGALLGSAATTVGGFGTLSIALLPSLQQFGIITGLTIIYAFLASVLVLPSLLVVWTRVIGPAEKLDVPPSADDGPGDTDTVGTAE